MTNSLVDLARRFLPTKLRQPLGAFYGRIRNAVFLSLLGVIFDMCGGRFRAGGCVFEIPKRLTSLAFRSCFLMDQYEKDERYLIPKYLKKTDTVLELGACLGVVSCLTNRLLASPDRHVVVEANPNCIPAIYRNRQINRCRFVVEHCAVTVDKEVQFYLHPRYITSSTLKEGHGVPTRIPGRSMKDLCERYGPFTVLIMDIEGGELQALEASREVLSQFRLVILELHDWIIGTEGVDRCRDILRQAGFHQVEQSFVTEAWRRDLQA